MRLVVQLWLVPKALISLVFLKFMFYKVRNYGLVEYTTLLQIVHIVCR